MGKLKKLIFITGGTAIVNYYYKNQDKFEKHKKLLKNKAKEALSYSKDMIEFNKENGLESTSKHIYKDLKTNVCSASSYIKNKVSDSIEYGKKLKNDTIELKNATINFKDKTSEVIKLANNSINIINTEIKPIFENYSEKIKNNLGTMSAKAKDLKNSVDTEEYKEKINNLKLETDNIKEKIKDNK